MREEACVTGRVSDIQINSPLRTAESTKGIAIDPKRQRLYVVSDRDGALYTY